MTTPIATATGALPAYQLRRRIKVISLSAPLARIAHQRPRPGVSGSLRMGFRLLIGGARATTSAAGAEKLAIGSIRARYEHEERVRPVAPPYPPVALRDEHANGAVYGV